jgi:hypothetical protein
MVGGVGGLPSGGLQSARSARAAQTSVLVMGKLKIWKSFSSSIDQIDAGHASQMQCADYEKRLILSIILGARTPSEQ